MDQTIDNLISTLIKRMNHILNDFLLSIFIYFPGKISNNLFFRGHFAAAAFADVFATVGENA